MINYVNIVGHVGARPEILHFKSGKKLAKFSIAVNQPDIGKESQKPLWLDIEAWESVAERLLKCGIDRGKKIAISGSIAPNVYRKEVGGTFVDIHKVKIKLNSFELMNEKKEPELTVSPASYDTDPEMTVHEMPSTKASFKLSKSKRSQQQ